MALNKKRLLNYRSVRFRTWMYFILFALVLVTFVFSIETLIFRAWFSRMKESEARAVAPRLHAHFYAEDFADTIHSESFFSGCRIYVFRVEGTEPVAIASSEAAANEPLLYEAYSHMVDAGSDSETFHTRDGSGTVLNVVVALKTKEGGRIYYLIATPISVQSIDTSVLVTQMIITVLLSVLLGLWLSLLLSRSLTRPLTELNKSAQALVGGKYDVTFKKNGQSEIDELADTLNAAAAEMRTTDELRRDLIANLSHDLRTPLTMIKAYAEMIRDVSGDNPEKRNAHLGVILDETDRLVALVGDLLDLSKIQSSAEKPDKSVFDLSTLVREICTRFDGIYKPEGYDLQIEIEPDLYVVADYKRIGQVVYNLVGNALNYVGEDKVILVSLTAQSSTVTLAVSDHGKGISPDDREHIWDRYFRSAESKRTRIGSGIGLSIVKSICESHGLAYGVDSVLGEGSRFWVRFGLAHNVANAADENAPAS